MKHLPIELRSNPIISESFKITTRSNKTSSMPRACSYCFYRNPKGGCSRGDDQPKKDFGIPLTEPMPRQIDGVEVGHYCKSWADYDIE